MSINSALVKQLRDERSWSQEHLAAVAGLSLRTIQRVESEGTASLDTRMAVASAFSVTPASLLTPKAEVSAAIQTARQRHFPGKPLGVVFGLSGAILGGLYAMKGIAGAGAEYGILGAWLGSTLGVAGLVFNTYCRNPR